MSKLQDRYHEAVKKNVEKEKFRTTTLVGKLLDKQSKSKFFSSRSTFFNITSIFLSAGIIGGTIALLELFQLRFYTEEKQNKELMEQKQKSSVMRNAIKKDFEEERKRLEEKAAKLKRDYEMQPVPLRPDYEKNETLFPILSPNNITQDEDDEFMDTPTIDDDEEAENNN